MKHAETIPYFIAYIFATVGAIELMERTAWGAGVAFAISWFAFYPLARRLWPAHITWRFLLGVVPGAAVVSVFELSRMNVIGRHSVADNGIGFMVFASVLVLGAYAGLKARGQRSSGPTSNHVTR